MKTAIVPTTAVTLSSETIVVATATNGKVYEINPDTKKCKKIASDLADLKMGDIEVAQMNMSAYQRYMKDKFPGEDVPLKKGYLHFRGYRVSCTVENGFMIEDTMNRYKVVETPFEGIPSPVELAEFFSKPIAGQTPEAKKKPKVEKVTVTVSEPVEVDFERLRMKVLGKLKGIQNGKVTDFDILMLPDMIPFKRWKRKVNAVLRDWKAKKIRYPKLLRLVEEITVQETFLVEDKVHRSSFVGTLLPEFKQVSELKDGKLCVDGKWIDAVPFMQNYLLHYEPKVMPQLMRYAEGEIDALELIQNPIHNDWRIEFNSKALKSSAENAQILDMVFCSVGIVSPQDLVYSGLEVGDKIMIFRNNGWKKDEVTDTTEGIVLHKGVGLLKTDKWIKL